ncbi:hypothetical protein L914_02051 [Phytophthora nicotianae]|uniref:Uncharacterized protein n=1 Tax=Phytophthora nicotianae TaxID=4792 RepID=W2P1F6_PHYNI|nr:hypothetical protein L914_02051 [Phytophthora nicotianae]
MRQRASTKTQRRLKQQQRDPYALTDDVYCEAPTFHVGGLVTAVGVVQLLVAMVLGGYVFGGALLFCFVLLGALGLALLHHSDPKGTKQGLGLKQAISRLVALRRSALDYSLTLSIAQSKEYQTQKKELQIAVVPSSPTPQKVVAAMALKPEETVKAKQKRKPTPLASNAPLATLNRVDMKSVPTIISEAADDLFMEKPRANSEPKQVLRSRPLLPLKPRMEKQAPVQEKKKKMQEKTVSVLPKTLEKPEIKTQKPRPLKKSEPKDPKVAAEKEVLPKAEPKAVIPVLPKAEPVELPKPKPTEVAHPTATDDVEPVAPVVAPLPVFPAVKPLVEVARGEPAMERELVVTRRVLFYSNPKVEAELDLEEQELEQELEQKQELELEHDPEDFALSIEAFPPLSPAMTPQEPTPLPAADVLEPNFLMDIELEPISKPEKKLISLSSLRLKQVDNADLRSMMDELDAMQSELDAAMARCTSLLNGDDDKEATSNASTLGLEPDGGEEPIFCC